jgi:hypothetical protein
MTCCNGACPRRNPDEVVDTGETQVRSGLPVALVVSGLALLGLYAWYRYARGGR